MPNYKYNKALKTWTSPSKNNFTNHFNHRCYPSTHMSALTNGTRYSPSRIHTHPDRPTCVSLRTSSSWIRAQSPYTFFLHEIDSSLGEGDSVYRGVGWGEGWLPNIWAERMEEKQTLWREVDPRGGVRETCASPVFPIALSRPLRHFLPYSQLAVWFRRVSALLPFKPLCMSTVTRETAPPSPSLPLELVSFNNHHHHQRRYEGKRLGDFPQSLCASDAFSGGDLSAKISDPLSLPLSFSLRGSVIQGFN